MPLRKGQLFEVMDKMTQIPESRIKAANLHPNMLCHGSQMWQLWLFGAVCFTLGLYLWNGLGPHFGLSAAEGKVDHWAAYASCGMLLLTVIAEVALSSN